MDKGKDKKIPSGKTGLPRIFRAFSFSWSGFKGMCGEDAFRQELALLAIGVAVLFVIGTPLPMKLVMLASLLAVLAAETLNTGIENLVDMVTSEYDERAKLIKDMGSLAVLLSFMAAILVWCAGLAMAPSLFPDNYGNTHPNSERTESGK